MFLLPARAFWVPGLQHLTYTSHSQMIEHANPNLVHPHLCRRAQRSNRSKLFWVNYQGLIYSICNSCWCQIRWTRIPCPTVIKRVKCGRVNTQRIRPYCCLNVSPLEIFQEGIICSRKTYQFWCWFVILRYMIFPSLSSCLRTTVNFCLFVAG